MNKEDVKKGYLAAMATMEVEPMYAEQYWESYEASQHWQVKNHGVSHHVSECDFCIDGKVDKPQYICQDCEDEFLGNSGR